MDKKKLPGDVEQSAKLMPGKRPDSEPQEVATSGQGAMSIIEAAESASVKPESATAEFNHSDFPEDPNWGMGRDSLPGRNDPEYRKNGHTTCFARALDAMKKTKLPIDQKLAVAACVASEIAKGGDYASFLRKLSFSADNGEVIATYSRNPASSDFHDKPYELRFSAEQIKEYHIPTLAGEYPSQHERELQSPQETLWKVSTRKGSALALHSYGVNHFLWPTRFGQFVITKNDNKTILAHIPIESLDLTVAEKTLMKTIRHELNEIRKAAMEASTEVIELERGFKKAAPMVGFWRWKKRAPSPEAEIADALWKKIGKLERRITDNSDIPEQLVLRARASGDKLAKVPEDFLEDVEAIKQDWAELLSEVDELKALAALKGIEKVSLI